MGGRKFDERLKGLGVRRGSVRDGGRVSWGYFGVRLVTDSERYYEAEPVEAGN
jgi:hypothetical protein